MIVVLTGGTGGAKFVQGLQQVVAPVDIAAIVNTGDDLTWWGLHVSPDIDSIMYALGGILSSERGWGIEADTFHCLERMKQLGAPSWFQLGDRDLATHLQRTQLLSAGTSLSEATAKISNSYDIISRILPMTNDRVETRVTTTVGELGFQEYFVRERYQLPVSSVQFVGAETATPAPGVLHAIHSADAVFIAPSNPITSIGPILAVPGIREALSNTAAPVISISPIVAGSAVSGPAGALMLAQGLTVSGEGIAHYYSDMLDTLLIDKQDAASSHIAGVELVGANIVMKNLQDKIELAKVALAIAGAATLNA